MGNEEDRPSVPVVEEPTTKSGGGIFGGSKTSTSDWDAQREQVAANRQAFLEKRDEEEKTGFVTFFKRLTESPEVKRAREEAAAAELAVAEAEAKIKAEEDRLKKIEAKRVAEEKAKKKAAKAEKEAAKAEAKAKKEAEAAAAAEEEEEKEVEDSK